MLGKVELVVFFWVSFVAWLSQAEWNEVHIKASDSHSGDHFGWSVTLLGDLLAVGAPAKNGTKGAVYIGRKDGSEWKQEAELFPPEGQKLEYQEKQHGSEKEVSSYTYEFGYSLTLERDGVNVLLAVGAPGYDSQTGAVFLYQRGTEDDNTELKEEGYYDKEEDKAQQQVWKLVAAVAAPKELTDHYDRFGHTVSMCACTMSHRVIIAVGAPGEDGSGGYTNPQHDNKAPGAGAAYAFSTVNRMGRYDQVFFEATLKANNPDPGDKFGSSVVASVDRIYVGAPDEDSGDQKNPYDNSLDNSGAVYGFSYDPEEGIWSFRSYIKPPVIVPYSYFGETIAVSESRRPKSKKEAGESSHKLIVGAPWDSQVKAGAGRVYIFDWMLGEEHELAELTALHKGGQFGSSIATARGKVIIGAAFESGGPPGITPYQQEGGEEEGPTAAQSGAAYVFKEVTAEREEDATYIAVAHIKAQSPHQGDNFGVALAASEDTILIGSPYEASDIFGAPKGENFDSGGIYLVRTSGRIKVLTANEERQKDTVVEDWTQTAEDIIP